MLPVTAEPISKDGLNLYGRSLLVADDLRRQRVRYPNKLSYICFQADLFYKEENEQVRDMEFKGNNKCR